MTKISCFVFLLCSTFSVLQAQNVEDLQAYEKAMKPGTQLTYDVSSGGKRYQLIATIKTLEGVISFDWKTTEAPSRSGSVTMPANVVAKADALYNYFGAGDIKLEGETALFLSRKVFDEIANTSMANVKVNGKEDTPIVMTNTIGEFNFNLNGNLTAVPGWEIQGGNEVKYTIQVLESSKFPLIYLLDIGWTMQLAEIKNP